MSADPVQDAVTNALTSSLGSGARELGELFADRIRYMRWKSAVKTLERAKKFAEPYGGIQQAPPLKFFLPFMENCSLEEEDDEVVDLWAHLLVDASRDFGPGHLLFMRILKEITGSEARLLQKICHCNGQSQIHSGALEDAISNWEMFNAPASPITKLLSKPLNELDIELLKDKIFELFNKPGIGIETLSITEQIGNNTPYEVDSIDLNETVFNHSDYLLLDILISLNIVKKIALTYKMESLPEIKAPVAGAFGCAYVVTAMGAAFYTSCSSPSVVTRSES